MHRFDGRARLLAALLAALAGYVDAVGFITLGGFFVSFMSGNSTRLGVGIVGNAGDAAVAAALVLAFVAGVVLGTVLERTRGLRVVLLLVAGLLAGAATTGSLGAVSVAVALAVVAMGAENAVFARDGVGLTYMTGSLVKLGVGIATAVRGEGRWAWAPHLVLWAGFVAGCVAGAAAQPRWGFAALFLASGVAAAAALVADGVVANGRRT